MKTVVISYSQTGRNTEIAKRIAIALKAEQIVIEELKPRKTMTVAWDLMFNRTPKVTPDPKVMDKYDRVIFCAPVWLGKPATPLRNYLKYIGRTDKPFGFVSLCGGAAGPNPSIIDGVKALTKRSPILITEMHIAEVLLEKNDTPPTQEQTQGYKPTDDDYKMYSARAVKQIREVI